MNNPASNLVNRLREALRTRIWVNLPEDIAEAADQIERLRAALERYGHHVDHCVGPQFDPVTMSTVDSCTCGFNATLSGDSSAPETKKDDARDAERYRYLRERQAFDRLAARKRVPVPPEGGREAYRTMRGEELDREIDACAGLPEETSKSRNQASSGAKVGAPVASGSLPNTLAAGGAGLHPAARPTIVTRDPPADYHGENDVPCPPPELL